MEIKYDTNYGFYVEENGSKLFITDDNPQSIDKLKQIYMNEMERRFDVCLSRLLISKLK